MIWICFDRLINFLRNIWEFIFLLRQQEQMIFDRHSWTCTDWLCILGGSLMINESTVFSIGRFELNFFINFELFLPFKLLNQAIDCIQIHLLKKIHASEF